MHTSFKSTSRRGFSLIELILVLVIMTILATLALQTVENQVDQTRFEGTQTQLSATDSAILDQTDVGNGRRVLSGFVVDMGRLPQAVAEVNSLGEGGLTARELWDRTLAGFSPLPEFDSVVADEDHVSNARDGDDPVDKDEDVVLFDSSITVDMGWRGPYLRLAPGADRLTDAWGHDLVSFTSTISSDAYSHLRTFDDNDVIAVGDPIIGVRSLGRDDSISTSPPYDQDVPAILVGSSNLALNENQLTGTVEGTLFVGRGHATSATDLLDELVIQIYYPDPDFDYRSATEEPIQGRIKVQQASNSSTQTDPVAEVFVLASPEADYPDYYRFQFKFSDGSTSGHQPIPVGQRIIRAYWNNGPDSSDDFGDGTSDPQYGSQPQAIRVFASTNDVQLTIPGP